VSIPTAALPNLALVTYLELVTHPRSSTATHAVHYVVPDDECRSYQAVLEFIGRRWVGAVLLAGSQGARRFSQYRALVPGISDRLLSQRLKELETYGLVQREVIPTTPVQIRYLPSPIGDDLIAALQPLIAWSANRRGTTGALPPGAPADAGEN
jgi:DNA-binding HxlR family transcriptional regulator